MRDTMASRLETMIAQDDILRRDIKTLFAIDHQRILDGALDAQDWPTAALALLAHPLGVQLGRTFSEPLAEIVFSGVCPEDIEWVINFRVQQIEHLEREKVTSHAPG